MNAYTWTLWETGAEYVVFANSEEEAKTFLETQYKKAELENKLFYEPCKVSPMPKGVVVFDTMRTVWLPKE